MQSKNTNQSYITSLQLIKENSGKFKAIADELQQKFESNFLDITPESKEIEFIGSLDGGNSFISALSNSFDKKMDFLNDLSNKNIDLMNKLSNTNLEFSSLEGKYICLFKSPFFVSNLRCSKDRNKNIETPDITVINHKYIDIKKIKGLRVPFENKGNQKSLFEFNVNEIVWGFVLPLKMDINFIKSVDMTSFLSQFVDTSGLSGSIIKIANITEQIIQVVRNEKISIDNYISVIQNDLNQITRQIDLRNNEQDRLSESIEVDKKALERLQNDIMRESKSLEYLISEKKSEINKYDAMKAQLASLNSEKQAMETEFETIRESIGQAKQELTSWQEKIVQIKNDVNITTLDMQGFSTETNRQLKRYYILAFVSISVLTSIFGLMFYNAVSFSDFIDSHLNANPWNIFLSRLPLITATTLTIGTISAFLFYIVNNIVSVSENKMNMLKAAILAEQITGTLPKEGMSEDEIRNLQRNTKIDLVMRVFRHKSESIYDGENHDLISGLLDYLKSKK
ncbi:hypothetical protein JRK39_002434 [Vibrio cholerae]|nr:hypothetical protein [Vibrio cholerae]EKF9881536.1 hypothetical protein [Vibrio cholerae]